MSKCGHELRANIVATEQDAGQTVTCQRTRPHKNHAWLGVVNNVLVAVKWEKQ